MDRKRLKLSEESDVPKEDLKAEIILLKQKLENTEAQLKLSNEQKGNSEAEVISLKAELKWSNEQKENSEAEVISLTQKLESIVEMSNDLKEDFKSKVIFYKRKLVDTETQLKLSNAEIEILEAKVMSLKEKSEMDFDLCVNCFDKEGRHHELEKLALGLENDSATCDPKPTNPEESRLLSIQQCVKYLVHTCQCKDANCELSSCQKMKRVIQHAKSCEEKTNGGCPICKQLIALCCFHAKHCQEAKCAVPFCVNIKNKLRQKQLEERLQQAEIAQLQPDSQFNLRQPSQSMGGPNDRPSSSAMRPIPQVMPHPGPSAGGMQRPSQAWQRLLQSLKSPSSAQQQQQILAILKSNPQLMAAFIKHRIAQQQQQRLLQDGSRMTPPQNML